MRTTAVGWRWPQPEGLHFSEAEFAPTFGRTSREIIAHFWGKGRYDDAQIADLDARKEAAFRRMIETDFPAMPGVTDLLHSPPRGPLPPGRRIVGPAGECRLGLGKARRRGLFGAIVTGERRDPRKTRSASVLTAAARLDVPPARCAVIEDAPAGVAAANAAGMASVGLLSTGRTPADLAAAHAVVRSLTEISPQMLRDLIDRRRSDAT